MHPHIQALYDIAAKPQRLIVGLMSGTSLDGLDVALCRVAGAGLQTRVELAAFATIAYDAAYRQRVKAIFSRRQVDLEDVCLMNAWIGRAHGAMILDCLRRWSVAPASVDLIASHGQTIYHSPRTQHGRADYPNATLQIGDGDHVAVTTGIVTISDFRQKHIAAGGEGAPLAVYGDYLIFSSAGENRIMLNMGGIANLTYLPKTRDAAAVFSADIGPGNTLMDAYVQAHFPGRTYDADAAIAGAGTVCAPLLAALKRHPFFDRPLPKTTGPELFNLDYLHAAQEASATQALAPSDVMATLNRFSADMIVRALHDCAARLGPYRIYASGGGVHNPLLMRNIQAQLPDIDIGSTAALGIDPDAKEAVLFALLANECVAGGKMAFGNRREGIPSVTMGKISFTD
ncbi:MAG: anhydro-N-acetylmuramic acid kinase [Alphaproteobacteria bacterium]|nr:MAG: anhydro-N-acetylmuramic acid kinase [Alphaproteobacteria bacterium]